MYQFTTTTIINGAKDSNGTTDKYTGTSAAFTVTRAGTYKQANILSVYKRPYSAAVQEIASIRVPSLTANKVARLTLDIRLSQQTDAEYANTYLYFKKPIVVEIIASGVAATDAAAFVTQLKGLKNTYGFNYLVNDNSYPVVTNTDYIQLKALNGNQRFYAITIELEDDSSTNSLVQPEYTLKAGGVTNGATLVGPTGGQVSVTTAGAVGFGDDEYMIRSIMLPTYENSRYFGTNKEERPIPGGNYTQYTLKYSIDKDGQDGIVAGGKSVTNAVFYVKSDLVSAFEAALANSYTNLVTIGGD